MESLYYLIPLFVILVFIMPVFITLKASYNVFNNRGAVGVFLFGKKLKSFIFSFSGMSIKIYNDKGIKEEDIDFESQEAVVVENLVGQIKDKTRLKLLQVNYNIGLGDAFQTAIFCGVVNFCILTFFTRLKSSKPTASMLVCDNIAYNQYVFESAVTLKFSISLFDIAYSFINSVILSLKKKSKK